MLTDRLSLVVGVTGHRDIADADEAPLRNAFGNVLRELSTTCPHTPLVVLSGLAAGADSLAAEEAIAQNIPVIACLPMPVAEYERDFLPTELARFRSLLASCARVTVTSAERQNGYVATGLFIVQYSHVLVAFWDGTSSRGKGGTADVLDMRTTGETGDLGPTYQIVTPRKSGPRPADACRVKRMYPKRFRNDVTSEVDFRTILGRMDLYNTDLAETPASAPTGEPLKELMDRTDAAANRLQKRTNLFQMILFACAFLGATIQILSVLPSLVKIVGIVAAFVAYRIARKNDYENRYQDYRALAEGLRVQHAWYCAGLIHDFADRAYLRMQEGELQWIRMALRSFYLTCCDDRECPDAAPDRPIGIDWVRSQWRYYYKASRREAGKKRLLGRTAVAAVAIGIASTIVSSVLSLPQWAHVGSWTIQPGWPRDFLSETLTVPLAMAAMLAALIDHYIEKQNFTANARRYERMFHVFDKALRELHAERGNTPRAQAILLALGRAALIEHADWLIARRDRPIGMVVV
jgi:hypothetical protein